MTEAVAAERQVNIRSLVLKTVMITPSGALSPGPLSAAAVALGAKLGAVAGLAIAFGHMLFEAPYIALLTRGYAGVARLLDRYGKLLNLVVVAFIVWFSYLLIKDGIHVLLARQVSESTLGATTGLLDALIAGIVLTGANAYFLLWWITVGFPLIRDAAVLGSTGFAVMYASHVWMDYAWLALLAASGGVARLIGPDAYGVLLIALAVLLLLFAVDIAARSYAGRRILPF